MVKEIFLHSSLPYSLSCPWGFAEGRDHIQLLRDEGGHRWEEWVLGTGIYGRRLAGGQGAERCVTPSKTQRWASVGYVLRPRSSSAGKNVEHRG